MEYRRFDPGPYRFPPPRLPIMPPLELRQLLASEGGAPDSAYRRVEAAANTALGFFTRARYALRQAYVLAGVGAQGGLLAPSYHCRTMLDGALQLGAPVDFYPLDEHLRPQLDVVRQRIESAKLRPRAVLVSHYFGFPQRCAPLRALCDELGVTLVEDCSHLGIVSGADPGLGQRGHWSVASPYKFFGCGEGGQLWSSRGEPIGAEALTAAPARELRALLRAWSSARESRRRASAPSAWPVHRDTAQAASSLGERLVRESGPSVAFAPDEVSLRGAPWSACIVRHSQLGRIARLRRARYQRLLQIVRGLPHCKPLFDDLPEGAVPYMFPLLIDRADPHFFVLKRRGVAVGRWDDMAVSDCAVASQYRSCLVHLPCHQGLSDDDMDWMCSELALALCAAHGNGVRA